MLSRIHVARLLTLQSKADVSPKTAARYLHQLGYYGRAARRKPLLCPANIKRRNDWARDMMERPQTFWNNVISSNESRFALFSDSGRVSEYGCGGFLVRSST